MSPYLLITLNASNRIVIKIINALLLFSYLTIWKSKNIRFSHLDKIDVLHDNTIWEPTSPWWTRTVGSNRLCISITWRTPAVPKMVAFWARVHIILWRRKWVVSYHADSLALSRGSLTDSLGLWSGWLSWLGYDCRNLIQSFKTLENRKCERHSIGNLNVMHIIPGVSFPTLFGSALGLGLRPRVSFGLGSFFFAAALDFAEEEAGRSVSDAALFFLLGAFFLGSEGGCKI